MTQRKDSGGIESRRPTILPHLDAARIVDIYDQAPGSEVDSGKFDNPESSAALAANTFGLFIDDASSLPRLPYLEGIRWQPESVKLEAVIRLPWSGGRHPCLDALIRTPDALIGIESKRYEPYRTKSTRAHSTAYQRDGWGNKMKGYCSVWSTIAGDKCHYKSLDVAQLIKHAFALRTQIHRGKDNSRRGILYYLFADPEFWPDGRRVDTSKRGTHIEEIKRFDAEIEGDEVRFAACSYRQLFAEWEESNSASLRDHARAVVEWAGLRTN